MRITQEQLDLIARTYDVVLEPEAWPEVLQGFSDQVRARATNVIVADHANPEVRIAAVSGGIPIALTEEFQRDWAHYEASAVARLLTYPARELVPVEELTGPSDELPSARWLRSRVGIGGRVCTRLNDHPAWADALTINLGVERPETLSPEEAEVCRVLLPHLAKAVEVSRPFQVLQARFRAAIAALDRLQLGVLILSERGQVAIRNREASRILELNDGLSVDRAGRPRAGAQDGELQAAIQRAVATACAQGQARESAMMISRRSGVDPFVVEVSPLHTGAQAFEPHLRGALVLVVDPAHRGVVSTRGMQQLYDLTAAEAQVLSLLVEGFGTQDIADQRNTSAETVRSQLKAVYSKTGLGTRAALVRLALTVNLPVDAPDAAGEKGPAN